MIWSDRLWVVSLMSALTDLKWRLRWPRHSDARRFSLFGIMSRHTMYKNLLAACAAVFSIHSAQAQPAAAVMPPLKVAVVHVTPVTEAGWVRQHENARLALEKALGERVQTRAVENVAEGADAERVIRDLAQQGYGLIFTPSFGYMEPDKGPAHYRLRTTLPTLYKLELTRKRLSMQKVPATASHMHTSEGDQRHEGDVDIQSLELKHGGSGGIGGVG